jgi:hypothetical protein
MLKHILRFEAVNLPTLFPGGKRKNRAHTILNDVAGPVFRDFLMAWKLRRAHHRRVLSY